MSKMTVPLIAVIAVAAVAIVGGVMVLNGDDKESGDGEKVYMDIPSVSDYARLNVLGNVDGDDDIDNDDLTYIKAVVAGTKDRTFYCDVNYDGYVDQKDVDALQKIINNEPTKVYYVSAANEVASVNLPMENLIIGFRRVTEMVGFLGSSDQIIALTEGGRGEFGFVGYPANATTDAHTINCGQKNDSNINSETLMNIYNEYKNNGKYTIVGDATGMDAKMESYVDGLGIDVVRICCTEKGRIAEGMVTLGFMLGYKADHKTLVNERLSWWVTLSDTLDKEIADAVSKMTESDKKKAIVTLFDVSSGGGLRIRGDTLTENILSTQAGCINLATIFQAGGPYASLNNESLPEAQKSYGLTDLVIQNQSLYKRILAAYNAAGDDADKKAAALNLIVTDSADIKSNEILEPFKGNCYFVGQDLCNGPETIIYKMYMAMIFSKGLDSKYTEDVINATQSEYMALLNPDTPLKDAKIIYKIEATA